ncbi:hypothetical protein BDN70DRAFT_891263 [Pholiota conissans]|uniref:Uncharacterized protein n=1 Tax=Pholiota conissans TaxID=109636 RepID=A0A9P6CXG5_9AGAR|nr:hypothetical protein BDN70DRAFT_891263 [Pholiota conissans]
MKYKARRDWRKGIDIIKTWGTEEVTIHLEANGHDKVKMFSERWWASLFYYYDRCYFNRLKADHELAFTMPMKRAAKRGRPENIADEYHNLRLVSDSNSSECNMDVNNVLFPPKRRSFNGFLDESGAHIASSFNSPTTGSPNPICDDTGEVPPSPTALVVGASLLARLGLQDNSPNSVRPATPTVGSSCLPPNEIVKGMRFLIHTKASKGPNLADEVLIAHQWLD